MGIPKSPQSSLIVKEETEKGDIAKSLEQLIKTHFVSKRYKDIAGSTRLTRYEILTLSLMEIQRVIAKLLSIDESSIEEDSLKQLPEDEQREVLELYHWKKRFAVNPMALTHAVFDSWSYMYVLGLQSLDGLSREEGVTMVAGTTKKILDQGEMGFLDKMRRRLTGNVLFVE